MFLPLHLARQPLAARLSSSLVNFESRLGPIGIGSTLPPLFLRSYAEQTGKTLKFKKRPKQLLVRNKTYESELDEDDYIPRWKKKKMKAAHKVIPESELLTEFRQCWLTNSHIQSDALLEYSLSDKVTTTLSAQMCEVLFESYRKRKKSDYSERLLEIMAAKKIPMTEYIFWNLLCSYQKCNLKKMLENFANLKQQFPPTHKIFTSLIFKLASFGKFEHIPTYLEEMKNAGLQPDLEVYNSIIVALARCGMIEEMKEYYNKMKKEGITPDTTTFNAQIELLARKKKYGHVGSLLKDMRDKGVPSDFETYKLLAVYQQR
eukprot:TRINITY_DN17477_c0_g1_i1.p1 TRINITY_DN17477_c0_g1~~TRINITY_DN17477_c0_g1_i1.p1  ORF type:complete len:318 (-),score=66.51 TRINITY_DN17477_c0_g1_i1:97-1050(-)